MTRAIKHAAFGQEKGQNYIIGYMCAVDYECELGCAAGGIAVYSSIEDLKECRKCVAECGILEVKVQVTKVIQESNFSEIKDDK